MRLDYSTVSVGRKKLKKKLEEKQDIVQLMERAEKRLSTIKI
jgi:hypothetical protein